MQKKIIKKLKLQLIVDIIFYMIEPKSIIRSNRRSLSLTINEKGELIVHAPMLMPLYDIFEFIKKKQPWIENKCNNITSILEKNRKIVEYEEIFFFGKRYSVATTEGLARPYLTDNSLLIPACKNKDKQKSVIKKWFVSCVEEVLIERIDKLAKFMKQKFGRINIINSRAKWGMCDSKHNLYFNWKLLMLTPELIDYVIIHELAHLIELNHSKKFWEIVRAVMPNYKQLRSLLQECGFLIKLFI